jgi:predicted PurR-regulated permease PerM
MLDLNISSPPATRIYVASCALAFIALYAVLELGLLSALLSGLLVYNLVHLAAPMLGRLGVDNVLAKTLALTILAIVFILLIAAAVFSGISLLTSGSENVVTLLKRMAEIIATTRIHLPDWASSYFPSNIEEMELLAAKWLRAHAGQLQLVGADIGMLVVRIIVGMVIGGLIALARERALREPGTLAIELSQRAGGLNRAFGNIVFSQLRISALNTFLTSIYLVGVLPLFGVQLPFVKTIIAVTFIAGLLPVVGNLISNTVIVVVSLSISAAAAIASLVFLVAIHKLEYFVNAKIIGSRIKARAWELLIAMLVMEAWFGIPGLVAAPIYYAYLKNELASRGLI